MLTMNIDYLHQKQSLELIRLGLFKMILLVIND